MRLSPAWFVVLLFSSLVGLPVPAATALTVSFWSASAGSLLTSANDGVGASSTQTVIPPSLPYAFTSSVSDGAVSSVAQYNLSNSSFDIALTQARSSGPNVGSYADGNVYFTVDQNATYQASGSFSVLDPVGRPTQYWSSLYDLTSPAYLYYSNQDSRVTPNETFTLGGLGGDFANQFNGSLNGTLIAGHIYQFFYTGSLSNALATTAGATASGDVHLQFAPIPEPGTALLVGFGLAALSLGRRPARRREG